MQYWIVKSGTKEVISGPFETQDEANKEMARFPVGGDAKTVTQGDYLGNGLIESVNGEWMSREDFDKKAEEIRKNVGGLRYDISGNTKYLQGQPYGKNKAKRRKIYAIAAGYRYRTGGVTSDGTPMVEMPEVLCAFSFEGELTYNDMSYLGDEWSAAFEKAEADAGIPVNPSRTVTFTNFESIYDLEKAKEELQYALQDLRDAKAAGEDKEVIKELQDEVKRCREVLNSLSESASYEKDMDENKPIVVKGVKGMKSTPFTKKFKNMAAYEKWADSEAAENFEVQQVMNESAVYDFSTTNDADILKVSAALEKAGIPFEVEEKGASFVVKVLDSRDQLVASELIGDTMKESVNLSDLAVGQRDAVNLLNLIGDYQTPIPYEITIFGYNQTALNVVQTDGNGNELDESEVDFGDLERMVRYMATKGVRSEIDYASGAIVVLDFQSIEESSGFSEGEEVKVVGNVSGEGKVGIIRDMAPSGHFYVVKFSDGTSSSYHESNLVAYEGDDDDEDLDESEDYSNVVSQHEHRNKSATVFKKSDGFEVVFYRDGGKLARDFYDSKEEAQSEAKAWVAGGVNESAQLSPFERAGLNPVYSEDGKKATVKIFSECEMEKFNKIIEAYLNTYIESIEYKVEESDNNCLCVIEVKLVQSPETKGDPETMMKELQTE